MVTLLRRHEFIGMQNGETVSGHMYTTSFEEFNKWLDENNINPRIVGYGLVPENFVLPYKIVADIVRSWGKVKPDIIETFNTYFLELIDANISTLS